MSAIEYLWGLAQPQSMKYGRDCLQPTMLILDMLKLADSYLSHCDHLSLNPPLLFYSYIKFNLTGPHIMDKYYQLFWAKHLSYETERR